MVLVASSRSARTALPSEQNQPGRLCVQAAQPIGAKSILEFRRFRLTAGIAVSSMAFSPVGAGSQPMNTAVAGSRNSAPSHREGQDTCGEYSCALSPEFEAGCQLQDVTGLTCVEWRAWVGSREMLTERELDRIFNGGMVPEAGIGVRYHFTVPVLLD
jgi:hypothetical protein